MKKVSILAIVVNLLIVFFEIIGFVLAFSSLGLEMFEYYTQDSNLLLLCSALIYVIYSIFNFQKDIPVWLKSLKYMATLSVLITFIVVITILSWTTNVGLINLLFSGSMLYHHTICPILAVISFVFLEKYEFTSIKYLIRSMYFTVLYAIIFIILNILKIVEGPYPFLMVYKQPIMMSFIWGLIILGGGYLLAKLLKKLNYKYSLKLK